MCEVGAVPFFNVSSELRNRKFNAFSGECFGGSGKGITHTQSADEDMRLVYGAKGGAGKLGESFF